MSEYLRDKIVFFLGAGASRYLGYPLMGTFLDEMKTAFGTGGGKPRTKAFEALLHFRGELSRVRNYVNTDFDNIEALYSAAEMYCIGRAEETIDVAGETITRDELFTELHANGNLICNDGGMESATVTDIQRFVSMFGVHV